MTFSGDFHFVRAAVQVHPCGLNSAVPACLCFLFTEKHYASSFQTVVFRHGLRKCNYYCNRKHYNTKIPYCDTLILTPLVTIIPVSVKNYVFYSCKYEFICSRELLYLIQNCRPYCTYLQPETSPPVK